MGSQEKEMSDRPAISRKLLLPELGMLRWRAQVRKFFFVAPQRKLRLSKAQLRSLCFKLLDATFNPNFYDRIWYGKSLDWL
jgi:hypothetical protein